MRKEFIYWGLLTAFLSGLNLFAQPNWSFGFYLLPQRTAFLNRQTELSNYSLQPTYGKAFGAALAFHPNALYYFQIQFLNSFQGQKFAYLETQTDSLGNPTSIATITRRYDLNYYKIPLNVGINIPLNKILSAEVYLGPQLSYLNTATYVLNGDTIVRNAKDYFFKQTLKKIDLGMVFGAGIFVQASSRLKFHTSVRMDVSLTDVDSRKFKTVVFATSKNFTIGLLFGLSYNFELRAQSNSKLKTSAP